MFTFGEKHKDYDVLVFNEREIRASAGIIFLIAIIAFMNAWLTGDNKPIQLMITIFWLDFTIRLFINPKYAPSMIIARWFVNNQNPEYVGAKPKLFAWSIGFILSLIMFYIVVLNDGRGPINFIVCLICLGLLFFEAVLGICLGCKIYNFISKNNKHCIGNSCAIIRQRDPIQTINIKQLVSLVLFIILIYFIPAITTKVQNIVISKKVESSCVVPKFAIDMGHEEKWKLHHGCKIQ